MRERLGTRSAATACGLLLLLAAPASCSYMPGVVPREYRPGERLQISVNSLTSLETEMPYDFYSLAFCRPPEGIRQIKTMGANLGTILQGLRIQNSPYNLSVMDEQLGLNACGDRKAAAPLTKRQTEIFKKRIDKAYRINMVLDNLPATMYDLESENEYVRPGFELGYKNDGRYYIHNHIRFNVLVHPTSGEYTDRTAAAAAAAAGAAVSEVPRGRRLAAAGGAGGAGGAGAGAAAGGAAARRMLLQDAVGDDSANAYYMIVGLEVMPCSVDRKPGGSIESVDCGTTVEEQPEPQEISEGAEIVYSYDVFWQISERRWASRWDAYLRMPGGRVHWFSIMNSLMICLIISSLVAAILIRTVRRDLSKYEELVLDDEPGLKEETGWKLLAGDVFRAPPAARMLCVCVGSGSQEGTDSSGAQCSKHAVEGGGKGGSATKGGCAS
ncbi:EMP nonaspanin domain family protein [Raphidocelis subcapitata]|uniref:Transmembrane 9 superfamily member n=1 Tax=Raphidocelis subcapitata TaxID=307507 RepID=A0A2V0NSD5_9CHLO|nr:EMP nonaspanin domain family protein [Raphidocelis subcapitata]|eukprot:GBF87847.1 EMP nonaspanin domain family protein [Raphidocelis subcapitata]